MRALWLLLCTLLIGCDTGGPSPEEAAPSAASAVNPDSPVVAVPPGTTRAITPQQYLEVAMAEAKARHEEELARCAGAHEVAACEISASATLEAAERGIRLEYEARLQEGESTPEGG